MTMTVTSAVGLFLLLVCGHYLAEFALQSSRMVALKSEAFRKGGDPLALHALTANAAQHALVTAGILWAFGGVSPWLAVVVGVTHWIIDAVKARRGWSNVNVELALHIAVLAGLVVFWKLEGGLDWGESCSLAGLSALS